MSQSDTDKNITEKNDSKKSNINKNDKNLLDGSTEKAIEQYRKLREDSGVELTEKQIAELDKQCEIIRNRETITQDTEHKPIEITTKNDEIVTGPPELWVHAHFNYHWAHLYLLKYQKMLLHRLKLPWKN